MKKLVLVLSCYVTLVQYATAQATWTFDDAHSNLQFSLTHLLVSEIEGSIEIKEATLITPNADFTDATIHILGDMATIDTDNDSRDEHLRSADFFDVEKYPTMTFTSNSFVKTGANTYIVKGDLTFHGITKNISLEVTANTAVRSYDNKTVVGFRVKGSIKRTDFGISVDTPEALLSDETQITANAIFVKS